jgi:hypothetical protein
MSDLPSRNAFREALHDLNDSQVDLSRLTDSPCHLPTPAAPASPNNKQIDTEFCGREISPLLKQGKAGGPADSMAADSARLAIGIFQGRAG